MPSAIATEAAIDIEPTHEQRSRAALAAVLDATRPRRVVFLGCGSGDTIPLEKLLRTAEVVDFADVNELALARLREQVDALGVVSAEVRCHTVDLTGRLDAARGWANELAFAADAPSECMTHLAARLLELVPLFWEAPGAGAYDLVVGTDVLTGLPTSVLKTIDAALRDRFGAAAYDPVARDVLNRATWTFTRTTEERFIGYLDTLVAPGGVVYLSDSVHVHAVTSADRSPASVGGAWRMTATPHLRDYLRPWHTLIDETSWDWWLEDPATDRWGRLYRMQAIAYRTPGAATSVASPRTVGALPALLVPGADRESAAPPAEAWPGTREGAPATQWLSRTVRLLGRDVTAYLLFGEIGYLAGGALTLALGISAGLSPWVLATLVALAPPSIYATAWLGKLRTGRQRLTFYRYAAVYLLVAVLALRVIGQPVLPHIELLVLGILVFQTFGRFGCLMAGCCHGRPSRFGVRYGVDHAGHGYPAHLAGVRVLPVPVLESLVSLLATAGGVWTLSSGAPVGATLAMCVAIYATGRFALEELRGDSGRPYPFGLSEAQWTSLALLAAIATAELLGWIPLVTGHIAVALALAVTGGVLVALRARRPRLLSPSQTRSMARALAGLRALPDGADDPTPHIAGAGELRISMQPVDAAAGEGWLVTVSRPRAWSRAAARRITMLVRELTLTPRVERLAGRPELLHLLLTPEGRTGSAGGRRSHGV